MADLKFPLNGIEIFELKIGFPTSRSKKRPRWIHQEMI